MPSDTMQPEPTSSGFGGTTVGSNGPIGYVLKMYPRFSETFVVTEILAREAAGEELVIFSLRPPTDARFHPELARVKAPVIQVERATSARSWWAGWQDLGPELTAGLADALPQLQQVSHDDAGQAVALARLAREHGVVHLHAHFASVATTVARLAGRIADLPYSFTAHAKDIFHADVDPVDLATKFTEAHHAVTISDYNLDHLRRVLPTGATERLHLVRNGLELSRFRCRTERPVSGSVRLLNVGRLVEKKGLHLAIEAVARLRADGVDCTLDIAGDGPVRPGLEDLVDALGVGEAVRFLGPRTQAEVIELMRRCDLFVAPFVIGSDGNADGLPTVLLEAMASGLPCVAGDVTAVGEVVDERTGWLVPSDDVAALVEALREAVTSPAERRRRAIAAHARITTEYDAARQAAALRRLVARELDKEQRHSKERAA